MKLSAHLVCSAISLFVFSQTRLLCAPLGRSVSPSRQFIVYGANDPLRGAVCELAERTKANLLALLRQPDRWKTPIVVNLQSPQANLPEIPPAALRFSQTGFGLKLQLDLTITQNVDGALVERELLRAIVLEMIYRSEPNLAPGTAFVEPPDWLLDGVLGLTPGRDRGTFVEALSASEKRMSLEEFLQQRPVPLDSPGRTLYRAYSVALVQLLVDGTDGRSRITRYIDKLSGASNDPLADLKAQFPLLSGDVEKTWQSSVARLSDVQSYQLLTFAESERRLDELLRVKIPDTGKSTKAVELSELAQRKTTAAEKTALSLLSQNLLLFAIRANPIMRPIAREYEQIVARLARGKWKGVAKRVAGLKDIRARIAARMSDIDDYMNWFEATQSKSGSGIFADYLRAADQPRAPGPRRRDALSVYLDALANQFED